MRVGPLGGMRFAVHVCYLFLLCSPGLFPTSSYLWFVSVLFTYCYSYIVPRYRSACIDIFFMCSYRYVPDIRLLETMYVLLTQNATSGEIVVGLLLDNGALINV